MKKILIIEDDPDILEILKIVFSTDIFEPVAYSRAIPIEMIAQISPDIIMLDHWLGDRSGGDLCNEIKASPAISKVPVVLLSSHPDLPDLAGESHADGFFSKPFNITRLYNYIRKLS